MHASLNPLTVTDGYRIINSWKYPLDIFYDLIVEIASEGQGAVWIKNTERLCLKPQIIVTNLKSDAIFLFIVDCRTNV